MLGFQKCHVFLKWIYASLSAQHYIVVWHFSWDPFKRFTVFSLHLKFVDLFTRNLVSAHFGTSLERIFSFGWEVQSPVVRKSKTKTFCLSIVFLKFSNLRSTCKRKKLLSVHMLQRAHGDSQKNIMLHVCIMWRFSYNQHQNFNEMTCSTLIEQL